jgi:hypothetical protein
MDPMFPTATLLARIKREAKAHARAGTMTHSDALEAGARAAGYGSWHALNAACTAPRTDALPIDPALPDDFDDTPNEDRPKAQLDAWWDRPYAVTNSEGSYDVLCLNGGAWDRSSWLGRASTIEEAAELAKRKQAEWVADRARPLLWVGLPPAGIAVVLMPQRPDEKRRILSRHATIEDAQAALADRLLIAPGPTAE